MLEWVGQYVDLDYMLWVRGYIFSVDHKLCFTQVKWLLSPIIITFVILPLLLLTLIYVSSLSLYIYQAHRKRLIR